MIKSLTSSTSIEVTPLGAGQDVGRSCILVSMNGKNIMLDCGMHMGFTDARKFPDFTYIVTEGPITNYIDCVIISHFHLDHCGALPYMTEMIGYTGPIYMTHPTKAICPILLEDMRKICVDKRNDHNFFTSQMIKNSMKKVTAVTLHQSIMVDDDFEIKAYYAGHVLGAAMFWIRVGDQSIVYTGDFNMTPDRHLGAARIDKCRPDLLITESTYATTIRDSKRCRETDFLKKVHECCERGGKVLIPVFALGRAQELCILLETYWDRMNLKYPIYFAAGLTEKANNYYKMFITWTNQKIRETFVKRNMFDFKHIKTFDRNFADHPGAMVVLASPGMLHAGLSLQLFKKWAPCENNMVIMPGFCVQGTVGHKVLSGARKIEFENRQVVEVKMAVEYMSFSAHADAKGIMKLIEICEPKSVLLVHGELEKMNFLKKQIMNEFGINCYNPANGETCSIQTTVAIKTNLSMSLLKNRDEQSMGAVVGAGNDDRPGTVGLSVPMSLTIQLTTDDSRRSGNNCRERIELKNFRNGQYLMHGLLVFKDSTAVALDAGKKSTNLECISNVDEACEKYVIKRHQVKFKFDVKIRFSELEFGENATNSVGVLKIVYCLLKKRLRKSWPIVLHENRTIQIESLRIQFKNSIVDDTNFVQNPLEIVFSNLYFELAQSILRILMRFT